MTNNFPGRSMLTLFVTKSTSELDFALVLNETRNCKGPHTINAANVGSIRELIHVLADQKFRLALSSHVYFSLSRHQSWRFGLLASRNTWCSNACFGAQVSLKYGTWYGERIILQVMCVGSLAGDSYFRYTALTSPKKGETAVHCCDSIFISSCHVDVSKRFSLSISLAVYRFSYS